MFLFHQIVMIESPMKTIMKSPRPKTVLRLIRTVRLTIITTDYMNIICDYHYVAPPPFPAFTLKIHPTSPRSTVLKKSPTQMVSTPSLYNPQVFKVTTQL